MQAHIESRKFYYKKNNAGHITGLARLFKCCPKDFMPEKLFVVDNLLASKQWGTGFNPVRITINSLKHNPSKRFRLFCFYQLPA